MTQLQQAKSTVLAYFSAMESATSQSVAGVLQRHLSVDIDWYGSYPFNQVKGPGAVATGFWEPLLRAFSSLQRRQDIFMAGVNEVSGDIWTMSMGHFMGLFDSEWLGIRPHRKTAMLRYAEFNCVDPASGRIVKTGMFCDIIALMQQVGLNPLPAQTGASFLCPGPRAHDGILLQPQAEEEGAKTLELLNRMIDDLNQLNLSGENNCPPEYLARTWAKDMVWYGPAGIGSAYTISRYQQQHQYPFREGLADKVYNGHVCRFAEGNYACFFGWPNLSHTPTGGFMGLPGGQRTDMRVVDVYRREGDKLLENWVLIDIPYWLKLQGLDVLERMRSIANPS